MHCCIGKNSLFHKPNHPSIILSVVIIFFNFVFQISPALSCSVAISVDCLQHDCQTHLHHSAAPVMLHSDEEN